MTSMIASGPKIDALREKVAAKELVVARAKLVQGGASGLFAHAHEELMKAQAFRAMSQTLSQTMANKERTPERQKQNLAILEQLADSPAAFARERRLIDRIEEEALFERCIVAASRRDLSAEVSLALLREVDGIGSLLAPNDVLRFALTPGRWSRRTTAISLLRQMAPREPLQLSSLLGPRENRWVQAAALPLLLLVDERSALSCVSERFLRAQRTEDHGLPSDDFLVREQWLRSLASSKPGRALFDLAYRDPTEHVRMVACEIDTDAERVIRATSADPSERVRAVALLSLAARAHAQAFMPIAAALANDKSDLVLRAACEGLTQHLSAVPPPPMNPVLQALDRALLRPDLPADARASVVAVRARARVVLDARLRPAFDAFGKAARLIPIEGSAQVTQFVDFTDTEIGSVLAELSTDNYGLSVDRKASEWILYRGEPRETAFWRVLYEIRHPLPSKRQGQIHSWARKPRGALRAPPTGLAELTATQVPGERVHIAALGGWGREVPMVDDLLTLGVLGQKNIQIASGTGLTSIRNAKGFFKRLATQVSLRFRYAEVAALRRRSLESGEPLVQQSFVSELSRRYGIVVQHTPSAQHIPLTPAALLQPEAPLQPQQAVLLPDFRDASEWVSELAHYALNPTGNSLTQISGYTSLILAGMLARGALTKRAIDRVRNAIPLVVGGWGTRGKSGTERIKAAMFQGLGYEVLVKTTGCEAMFIHAMPEIPAQEVFIYRPYDKATVWEQRDLLTLASRFGAKVFLWECMALQPDLVNLLQQQWTRDDFSTLTNAYPDHEDVQGPAGVDVAECISEFIPVRGEVFSSEEGMMPILQAKAEERGTRFTRVAKMQGELISKELLLRFPYHEHPSNIALVTELAKRLGIAKSMAIVEMADNVVPDLGVLKTYPKLVHEGRLLSFTNGMSANERTGAYANWLRMSFDKHDSDVESSRWIVTVVNNRADRVSRSEVFARFVVEDIGAHRHVLIGTNISGLLGFLREALSNFLKKSAPSVDLPETPEERLRLARERVVKAFNRLKVGSPRAVVSELAAITGEPATPALEVARQALVAPAFESYAASLEAAERALPAELSHNRAFLVEVLAKRRALASVLASVEAEITTGAKRVDDHFISVYTAIFEASLIPLHESALSGDQVIDRIAKAIPIGTEGSIMGLQNIKGTGLDFVYRWVGADTTCRALAKLTGPSEAERAAGLLELSVHGDWGLLDARHVRERLKTSDPALTAGVAALQAKLDAVILEKQTALGKATKSGSGFSAFIGLTFDFLDAVRRTHMAGAVLDSLVSGHISHASAAKKMRAILARSKGAWMQ
jgi:gamma-polyglutamate synthase